MVHSPGKQSRVTMAVRRSWAPLQTTEHAPRTFIVSCYNRYSWRLFYIIDWTSSIMAWLGLQRPHKRTALHLGCRQSIILDKTVDSRSYFFFLFIWWKSIKWLKSYKNLFSSRLRLLPSWIQPYSRIKVLSYFGFENSIFVYNLWKSVRGSKVTAMFEIWNWGVFSASGGLLG